jgi:hypothetical protein
MIMASQDTEFDSVFKSIRGIFAELFGTRRSSTRRADVPMYGSARAELACALEALRYYLYTSTSRPSKADVRWFYTRVDEIFSEFYQNRL